MNYREPGLSQVIEIREAGGKEFIFYLLVCLLFAFGFLKVFYARYFNNLFRLYFNSSLRQGQLTDLILQAKLSSLIYNIFFFISGGIYLFFLLDWFGYLKGIQPLAGIALSVIIVAAIYTLKYFGLLFFGWLSGMKETAGIYIFITFMINKIWGIILLPFLVIIAFSPESMAQSAVILSITLSGLLFLSRYLRSYSLLESQLKMSAFHFLILVLAVEILPLLLLYKGLFLGLDHFSNWPTFHKTL